MESSPIRSSIRVSLLKAVTFTGIAWLSTILFQGAVAQAQIPCGDCNLDSIVAATDLIQIVGDILGDEATCSSGDANRDQRLTLEDLILLVGESPIPCEEATPTPTVTPIPGDSQNPPTEASALRQWLVNGSYLGWHAESGPHTSGGPHGGKVRTFLNDAVFESLTAGSSEHPRGAAVVKELYFGQDSVQEWAVEVKLEDTSDGGNNWYWYEGVGLSGRGLRICTGCHSRAYRSFTSKDFVLTPFPLQ